MFIDEFYDKFFHMRVEVLSSKQHNRISLTIKKYLEEYTSKFGYNNLKVSSIKSRIRGFQLTQLIKSLIVV